MSKSESTVLGFMVASIMPALILAVLAPLSGTLNVPTVIGTFVVFYLFSAIATLAFGAPIFLILRRFKIVSWWSALMGGFFAGVLVTVAIRLPSPPAINDVLTNGPIGAASAFAFWLVWRLGQDEQS